MNAAYLSHHKSPDKTLTIRRKEALELSTAQLLYEVEFLIIIQNKKYHIKFISPIDGEIRLCNELAWGHE